MGRVLSRAEAESPLTGREFELTEQDFKYIQYFVHKSVGIFLSDKKKAMVYGRISRILREHGFRSFSEYRELLEINDAEKVNFTPNSFAAYLRTHESKTIGIVIPRLNHYFFSSILNGIISEAEKHEYMTFILCSEVSY